MDAGAAVRGTLTPAPGRGIGSRLLVPTVNLAQYDGLLPAFGVYVTRLKVDGRAFQAVTNVGNRPTFGEPSFAVESHILDFEPGNSAKTLRWSSNSCCACAANTNGLRRNR